MKVCDNADSDDRAATNTKNLPHTHPVSFCLVEVKLPENGDCGMWMSEASTPNVCLTPGTDQVDAAAASAHAPPGQSGNCFRPMQIGPDC
jgi:hypothetical protein